MKYQAQLINKGKTEKEKTDLEIAEAKKKETEEIILTVLLAILVILVIYLIASSRKNNNSISLTEALPFIDDIK